MVMGKKWLGVLLACFLLAIVAGNSCYADQEAIFSITVPNATLQLTVPESASLEFTPTSSATLKNTTVDINVGTNNITGYTLTMTPESSDDDYQTSLIGTSNKTARIDTLATEVSGYTDASFTTNRWGYRLGSEGNYFAVPATLAPTSWITDGPANSSTKSLTLAAKIDGYQAADTYTTKLVFHAVTNAVPYEVIYNANTTDTVTDLPTDQSGTTYGEVTLSSTKPSRGDYGFFGWCTQVTEGATCPGTTYRAGQTVQLDGAVGGTLNLYAIWGTYAELDTGQNINGKMKSIAANTPKSYLDTTSDIKAIKRSSELPSGFTPSTDNTISLLMSAHAPVYIWYDNTNNEGILYYYSTVDRLRMNADSAYVFSYNSALSDISGLVDWDSSNVTSLRSAFYGATPLSDISVLANWDISNVTSLRTTFGGADQNNPMSIANLSPLSNWDTSNVTDMTGIFQLATSLTSLHGLEKWNTANVENMPGAFMGTSNAPMHIVDISALSDWDISSVTNMYSLFQQNIELANIDALSSWNTSSVENMKNMFSGTSITNIDSLATGIRPGKNYISWDMSNVENMYAMFFNTKNLTNIDGATNWNTSNVVNMSWLFGMSAGKSKTDNPIIDLTPLTNWNVGNVTDMSVMFLNVNIASYEPLSGWDVSKVENFNNTFNQTAYSTVTSLHGLEGWDVHNATDMNSMFADNASLSDASAINDWNISSVTDFGQMFAGTPVHPEFTKRTGTWESDGTFTPDL